MDSIWILIIVIAVWIFLQAYLLPKFGVSTWLKPGCQAADKDKPTQIQNK
jgi:hypothetical protein